MSVPEEEMELVSSVAEVEVDEPEYETLDDGSAVFSVNDDDDSTPPGDAGFYDNLANPALGVVDFSDLNTIATDLLYKIDIDRQARADRDKQYEEGLRRTGLGDDAPGGGQFIGASRTVHPMLIKATIDFGSHVMKELFPADGPVKTKIPGTETQARLEKAKRKQRMLNWQLTVQMQEFRNVLEKTIIQVPLGGVQYIRLVWDQGMGRPVSRFVSVSDILLPYDAVDFYTSERMTFVERVPEDEYMLRVEQGVYLDDSITSVSMSPERTKSGKQQDKIIGATQDPENIDGTRTVYETVTYLNIEGFRAPYIVRLDDEGNTVKAIIRNWEEGDKYRQSMDWIIEFPFIPWDGPQAIGLSHIIGGLSGAATGALRALLDSAHINNFPTGLVLDGTSTSGQAINLQPTTLQRIKGGSTSSDDIRKVVMGLPFNPPSNVLFELMKFLVQTGEDVVRTVFQDLQDNSGQAPVGTTMMMIENVSKIISSIHARLHSSFQRLLLTLSRLNRMYQIDGAIKDEAGEVLAYREDFTGPLDVVPVSDPNIFSEVQRYSQMQAIVQRSDTHPGMYDPWAVEELMLRQLKVPDADKLLKKPKQPERMNPVNENVSMTMGNPVMAFPDQDHLAHMQVLLDYLKSPVLGMLSVIAPSFLPMALGHLKEHISMWYVTQMDTMLRTVTGKETTSLMKFKDPETSAELDKALAAASHLVVDQMNKTLGAIPPIIAEAQKFLSQVMPPQPGDPAQAQIQAESMKQQTAREKLAARQQEVQGQTATQLKLAELAERNKAAIADKTMQHENELEQARTLRTMQQEEVRQQNENQRTAETNQTRLDINSDDNMTALTIAQADLASAEDTSVSTGSGINPRPSST